MISIILSVLCLIGVIILLKYTYVKLVSDFNNQVAVKQLVFVYIIYIICVVITLYIIYININNLSAYE